MKYKRTNILNHFTKKWQTLLYFEVVLLTLSVGLLIYFISSNLILAIIFALVTLLVASLLKKPWNTTIQHSINFIDSKLSQVEYSSGLLVREDNELSNIAKLQRLKISKELEQNIKNVQPPTSILRTSIISVLIVALGFIAYMADLKSYFKTNEVPEKIEHSIGFQAIDSTGSQYISPKLIEQNLSINYPNYTGLATSNSTDMNIKAVEGSKVSWSLKFDIPVNSVHLESTSNTYDLVEKNGAYTGGTTLLNSGFYSFKFVDSLDHTYTSDLYAIEVLQDESPEIKLDGLSKHTSFDFNEPKRINLQPSITDDYGVADAYIIATVSKGSGESVKFREEKIEFNSKISRGSKALNPFKTIDLDNLQMEPGDELYFYVEALDLKQPEPNISRSETYFAVVNDTVTDQFSVEGTMGVNRMPDYFRSQRQLIIDTEKLIANKKNLTEYEFKFASNELGFDQKALRLKYSAFMGEETENIDLEPEDDHDHDHESDNKKNEENDPLAQYTHDHDNENRHNLVDEKKSKEKALSNDHGHDHSHDHGEDSEDDPLEKYQHNHDDSETTTLFEESLKSKLRKALQQMWDSELQLRLYQPEASLPYQYKALKYLQDIKNSARIYVHRIGFDPPPIKEESRLTGELDDVHSFSKQKDLELEDDYKFMRQSVSRLEELIKSEANFGQSDQLLFENAGNELAVLAVESPGNYLKTLQQLKQLTTFGDKPIELLKEVQNGLLQALPHLKPRPNKQDDINDELNELLLKELELNDRK